jgi:hypothetical protein
MSSSQDVSRSLLLSTGGARVVPSNVGARKK